MISKTMKYATAKAVNAVDDLTAMGYELPKDLRTELVTAVKILQSIQVYVIGAGREQDGH